MQRFFVFSICALLLSFIAAPALAQQAPQTPPAPATRVAGVTGVADVADVQGRWTGSFQVPNGGEMEMVATFKKDKDSYTGVITVVGMAGERPLKSVKVDGDQVKAQAEFEMPDGNVVVNYTLTLKDDTLKGKGEVDFGGQKITFDVNLKRATEK